MAYMYCTSCGAKLQYSVSKPKFCSECGEGIHSVAASSKKEVVVDDQDDSVFKKPISLDYEISAAQKPNLTLGSVIGTDEGSKVERREAPKNRSNDPLGDALRECSSSRGKRDE